MSAVVQMFVQVTVAGFGGEVDLDLRYAIEDTVGDRLSRADIGYCDGGELGGGAVRAYFYVSDVGRALVLMIASIRALGLTNAATIAARDPSGYRVLYPANGGALELRGA